VKDNRNVNANPLKGKRRRPAVQIDWSRPVGRQVLDRVLPSGEFDKLLRMSRRRARRGDGFHKATSGAAAAMLDILHDSQARQTLLTPARVSPATFRSGEDCARSLAIGWMIGDMATKLDDDAYRRLAKYEIERQKARTLRGLGEEFGEDADRHDREAADLMKAVEVAHGAVRYLGRCLERDFDSLRAPRLVADFVTRAFGMTPKMTERQVRYLCGWERRYVRDALGSHNLR
jgi:hypothetical protein